MFFYGRGGTDEMAPGKSIGRAERDPGPKIDALLFADDRYWVAGVAAPIVLPRHLYFGPAFNILTRVLLLRILIFR